MLPQMTMDAPITEIIGSLGRRFTRGYAPIISTTRYEGAQVLRTQDIFQSGYPVSRSHSWDTGLVFAEALLYVFVSVLLSRLEDMRPTCQGR